MAKPGVLAAGGLTEQRTAESRRAEPQTRERLRTHDPHDISYLSFFNPER
jgi:hypothetical protein